MSIKQTFLCALLIVTSCNMLRFSSARILLNESPKDNPTNMFIPSDDSKDDVSPPSLLPSVKVFGVDVVPKIPTMDNIMPPMPSMDNIIPPMPSMNKLMLKIPSMGNIIPPMPSMDDMMPPMPAFTSFAPTPATGPDGVPIVYRGQGEKSVNGNSNNWWYEVDANGKVNTSPNFFSDQRVPQEVKVQVQYWASHLKNRGRRQ